MPDLDLSALRKVAEAAHPSATPIKTFEFVEAFMPETCLALIDELVNAQITAREDRRYVEETDERMKPHLAKAWWEGVNAQWTHLPPGNRVPQAKSPYITP